MGVITRTTFDLSNGGDLVLPNGPFDGTTSIFGVQWGVVATPTPFNFGQVLRTSPFFSGNIYKLMPTPEQDIYFMLRCRCDSGAFQVTWADDNQRQVDILWDGVSDIVVRNVHGELARWRNAYTEGQWNHFQVRTTISHDLGVVRIRKNGATADSFEACSLNTQETSHAYANRVYLETGENSAWSYIDDFAAWDLNGPGPWNNWMGDIRAMARMAIRDESVVMTKTYPGGRSTDFGFPADVSPTTLPANTLHLFPMRVVPEIGGQLSDVTLKMDAGFTGNIVCGLYAAGGYRDGIEGNGAVPGKLMASTDVLVNPVTGSNTLTWSGTAPSIATGANYWLAIWSDQPITARGPNYGSGSIYYAATYTGSLPDIFQAEIATINIFTVPPTFSATLTVTNAACVDELPEDGATTMVSSDVLNDEDVYGVEALPPKGFKNIVGVDLVMVAAKSTAGTRGITAKLTSGASVVTEPEFFPNTSFAIEKYAQDVDPATGLPWVKADLDAVLIGDKVTT